MRRFPVAVLPTPIHELPRLRAALGGPARCPKILIKRDDLTGLALGGNKARKLEYLIGDALDQGATVVLTTGAAQSNHARMTAAAARAAGLDVHLVLTADGQPGHAGQPAARSAIRRDDSLRAAARGPDAGDERRGSGEGRGGDGGPESAMASGPYEIPVGGSSGVGVLGYTYGTREIVDELAAIERAADAAVLRQRLSRNTSRSHPGREVVRRALRVYGVAVSGGESFKRERALRIANEAAVLAGIETRVTADDSSLTKGTSATATASPRRVPRSDSSAGRDARESCSTRVHAKAMACLIDHARMQVSSIPIPPSCSCIPAACRRSSPTPNCSP